MLDDRETGAFRVADDIGLAAQSQRKP